MLWSCEIGNNTVFVNGDREGGDRGGIHRVMAHLALSRTVVRLAMYNLHCNV